MPRRLVGMRVPSRRSAHTTRFRALIVALLAVGLAVPARAGGSASPGVLQEVSLEGSGTPRRAGASDPGAAVPPDPEPAPFSATYDVAKQNDLELSRASMPTLPPHAVPVDVRMDVASFPDTTAEISAARRAPGVHEEFRSGKTLVWCQSFLLSDLLRRAAPDAAGAKMSVVAVEPLPGSPDVHHMHLHVCDADSRAFQTHAALFEEGTSRPKTCLPPSWTPGSGCHGTAWTFLPGQEPVVFPEGVGFTVGGDDADGDDLAVRRVVLEVHYDGADAMKGAADFSGLRLWATKDWEKDAKMRVGLLSVADPFARLPQNLPADTADARYTTHCPPGCTKTFAAPLRAFFPGGQWFCCEGRGEEHCFFAGLCMRLMPPYHHPLEARDDASLIVARLHRAQAADGYAFSIVPRSSRCLYYYARVVLWRRFGVRVRLLPGFPPNVVPPFT